MSRKKVERIMFYDEKQKTWVVDTMEVEEDNERPESDQISSSEKDSCANRSLSCL
jgi:hypothetical protein